MRRYADRAVDCNELLAAERVWAEGVPPELHEVLQEHLREHHRVEDAPADGDHGVVCFRAVRKAI